MLPFHILLEFQVEHDSLFCWHLFSSFWIEKVSILVEVRAQAECGIFCWVGGLASPFCLWRKRDCMQRRNACCVSWSWKGHPCRNWMINNRFLRAPSRKQTRAVRQVHTSREKRHTTRAALSAIPACLARGPSETKVSSRHRAGSLT